MTEDFAFDEELIKKIQSFFEKPAPTDCQDFNNSKRGARLIFCLAALKQNRARQILLEIQSKRPEMEEINIGCNNFQLLHDEYALAAKAGFKARMKTAQIQIRKIMVHVQATDEGKS